MKKTFLSAFLALATGTGAWAQANHWILYPNYAMNAASGWVSQFATSSLGSCIPNTQEHPGVLSNNATGSYRSYDACGFYDNTATNLVGAGGGNINMQAFEIPAKCAEEEQFYTVGWEGPNAHFDYWRLALKKYSGSGASLTLLNTQYLLDSLFTMTRNYAVSRLEPGGWRALFATYDNHWERWDIDPNGNVLGTQSGNLLTTSSPSGPFTALPDNMINMEVSADGKYIIYVAPSGSGRAVHLYDIYNNVDNTIFNYAGIISGIEYVPQSALAPGQSPRVYFSYHKTTTAGSGNIEYYEVGTGLVYNGMNSSITSPSYYGFSELELAKDGRLYLAYNPDAFNLMSGGSYGCPNPGQLVTLDMSGNISPVYESGGTGSAVPVYARDIQFGYIIQNQIDGENYSRECNPEHCTAAFLALVDTRNPYNVDFSAVGAGPYVWTAASGATTTTSSASYSYNYGAAGTYDPKLKIIHPWDYCLQRLHLCLNTPRKSRGTTGNPPCNQSSDFIMQFESNNQQEVSLAPVSGSEPYYNLSWGDGVTATSPVPLGWTHTYTAQGSYTVCLETGNGTGCKTCTDICIPDPNTLTKADDGDKPSGNNVQTATEGNLAQLQVYPNPANDLVNVEIPSSVNEMATITISDLLGKTMSTFERTLVAGSNKFDLPLTGLPAANYLLSVKTSTTVATKLLTVKK